MPMRQISIKLPKNQLIGLKKIKEREGRGSVTEIIREAIAGFLKSKEEQDALYKFIAQNFNGNEPEMKKLLKELIKKIAANKEEKEVLSNEKQTA